MNTPRRHLAPVAAVLALGVAAAAAATDPAASTDPFAVLAPTIVISPKDRARLDRNEVLARVLPGQDGQLAVMIGTRLEARPDALPAWTRAIEQFKRGKLVLGIGRFSNPPKVSDLEGLTLDDRDLEAIRRCRPGDCDLKLSAAEIESLRSVVSRNESNWREAALAEFRRLLVERVRSYEAAGLSGLPAPADDDDSRPPDAALMAIADRLGFLERIPAVASFVRRYPHQSRGVESFYYWSKEYYGEGKPVVAITHVGIASPGPPGPDVVVAAKQIFATHYLEGSLGITMVLRDRAAGTSYLVYVNRSQLDVLRGFFGGLVRGVFESRVKRQAPDIVRVMRARLESGLPSESTSAVASIGRR